MEIKEIWERAFGQFYRGGDEIGIVRYKKVDNEIQLEAINFSTVRAIKDRKNNEDRDTKDIVPREYHHLLDVFEKEEKTTLPQHKPGIDFGIDVEEGKRIPIKRIYALSYDLSEELHRYLKQHEQRG